MVVEWTFRENAAERIDTALVNAGLCHLKCVFMSNAEEEEEEEEEEMCFKVISRSKWAVLNKNETE